jgi:hypothetical protein
VTPPRSPGLFIVDGHKLGRASVGGNGVEDTEGRSSAGGADVGARGE